MCIFKLLQHMVLAALATSIVLSIGVELGFILASVPYPAVGLYVNPSIPKDVMPWRVGQREGPFTTNSRMAAAVRLFEGKVLGSESVTMAPDGRLVMLDKYGLVWEASEISKHEFEMNPKPLAHLGSGRPLGAAFDKGGNMVICDAIKGIVMLEKDTKTVQILTNRVSPTSPIAPGMPLMYANDLDIAEDGTIFFTTSVDMYPQRNAQYHARIQHIPSLYGIGGFYDTVKGWGLGMCHGHPKSYIMKYNPRTKETIVLSEGWWFANGVALSQDERFLAVSETDRQRVMKLWLKGPKAGQTEVLINYLPGSPDGLHRAPDGSFWVPLLSKHPPFSRFLKSPLIRTIMPRIPEAWRPYVAEWGAAVKLSENGDVVDFLMDDSPNPVAYRISSAHEHGGKLFLGNLVTDFVSYVDLAKLPPFTYPSSDSSLGSWGSKRSVQAAVQASLEPTAGPAGSNDIVRQFVV